MDSEHRPTTSAIFGADGTARLPSRVPQRLFYVPSNSGNLTYRAKNFLFLSIIKGNSKNILRSPLAIKAELILTLIISISGCIIVSIATFLPFYSNPLLILLIHLIQRSSTSVQPLSSFSSTLSLNQSPILARFIRFGFALSYYKSPVCLFSTSYSTSLPCALNVFSIKPTGV